MAAYLRDGLSARETRTTKYTRGTRAMEKISFFVRVCVYTYTFRRVSAGK